MNAKPIHTRILHPPKDDLFGVIRKAVKKLPEKSILAVASKIVSIGEGQCVAKEDVEDKDELIMQEADKYLPRSEAPGGWVMHTIKNRLLMPSAGVDASNSGDYYILWPKNPMRSAKKLYTWLKKEYKVNDIGVIITDSHTIPMRRGMVGVSLGYYGFKPLYDYRGTGDLFGRKLKMTHKNIVDALAVTAVVEMGEGSESTPLALLTNLKWVTFTDKSFRPRKPFSSLEIETREDLYAPFLNSVRWKTKRRK